MNNGQFTNGYDSRRNLEGRPHGSKNYTTILSNFIEATVNYTNPLTDEKIDCTPPEALIMHLYYLAIVKDNTAAAKLLFDKIEAISAEQKINYDNMSYEDAKAEVKRHYELMSISTLNNKIDELKEIIGRKERGELRNP